MRIVEEFYTLQGEGKFLGVPSYFIRTTGCNLRCAWKNPAGDITLCDTPYTSWKPEKGDNFNIDKFIQDNGDKPFNHIVITGGEPTMQRDIAQIVNKLQEYKYDITIETNGTIYVPGIKNVFLSISPKLKNSYAQTGGVEKNMHTKNNHFINTIKQWMVDNDYQIKFVYNDVSDLDEILDIKEQIGAPANKIYLMPQGISTEQFKYKEKQMFEICKEYGFNYSPRMHVDIFGNKRGI
jgi:7-carboxy-7-deazaguanine synthase